MKTQLLVPAAGSGVRLGCAGPKALVDVSGKPLLVRTLERFAGLGMTRGALVLAPPEAVETFRAILDAAFPGCGIAVLPGGAERQDSVYSGVLALDPDTEIVAIHDAARPFVAPESVRASIDAAVRNGAATVAIRTVDTILVGDEGNHLVSTPDRSNLWCCQTPQTFRVEVIRHAHETARAHGFLGTDDATLVQRTGGRVKLVPGTPLNIKITTPADLALAHIIVERGLA